MKIKELIERLKKYHEENDIVIVSQNGRYTQITGFMVCSNEDMTGTFRKPYIVITVKE